MAKQIKPKSDESITKNVQALNQNQIDESQASLDAGKKFSVMTKAEELERQNIADQKQIIEETDELAAGMLKAAFEIQKSSEIGSLRDELAGLRSAINTLKSTSALSAQSKSSLVSQVQPVSDRHDCGCGCGETKEKKCCIEIYGSGVRVLKAGDGPVPTLELILAIQAGGVKAVFPGLTSQINVNQNVGWVKVDWPITKICVLCSQQMLIPLVVEAMDIDKAFSVPEKGSNTGAMSINCNCNSCSVTIDVNLSSGSMLGLEKKGQIMVEVSARRVSGGCCC